ncbi:MAG: pyrroline-5-carboxylate reductase [Verrucomicrobiota bacterium]
MKLGIIGCGKMATALVQGAVRAGLVKPTDVTGHSPTAKSRDAFSAATGAATVASATEVVVASEVILLATKPHDIVKVMEAAAKDANGAPRLIISVAAGVTLAALEAAAPANFRVIRSMPNTPSVVGQGAAAYCLGARAGAEDAELARNFFSSVGLALEVPEKLMDAVVGVSGSGPAYIYLVIEAMADGGVRGGIPRADALRLAAQTVAGAAAMVLETGEHPAVLKDKVTSPGGTTIAALATLERHGVRSAFIEAVDAALQRSVELGK